MSESGGRNSIMMDHKFSPNKTLMIQSGQTKLKKLNQNQLVPNSKQNNSKVLRVLKIKTFRADNPTQVLMTKSPENKDEDVNSENSKVNSELKSI